MKHKTRYLNAIMEPAALGVWLAEQFAHDDVFYCIVAQNTHNARDIVAYARFHLAPDIPINLLPDSGLLPYDYLVSQESIVAERLSLLRTLSHQTSGLLVITLTTLLHRLPPPAFVAHSQFTLEQGGAFDYSGTLLLENGYRQVQKVDGAGEFCRRGEVLDIFPINGREPLRIVLDDDTIETIHTLNTDTQRTQQALPACHLLSRHEFPFDQTTRQQFCQRFLERFPHCHTSPLIAHARNGTIAPGFDSFMPLFFDNTASLFDFLPATTHLVTADNTETHDKLSQWHSFIARRYDLEQERNIAALSPNDLLLSEQELFTAYKQYQRVVYTTKNNTQKPSRFTSSDTALANTAHLALKQRCHKLLEDMPTHTKLLVLTHSASRGQVLLEKMQQLGMTVAPKVIAHITHISSHQVQVAIADVIRGFVDTKTSRVYTPLSHLEQTRGQHREANNTEAVHAITLHDVHVGECLVHYEHGIGRFLGVDQDEGEEFIRLEYAKGQMLFVPMNMLHMLSRYTHASDSPVGLHSLGQKKWHKDKKAAWKKAQDTAAELLAAQAARKSSHAPVCTVNEQSYRIFVDGFAYQETDDQKKAIADIEKDMQATTPMDRLLCGDVGLGKTEVALRAACIAVQNGYQVAFLVPTTLLCEQHFERIQERFAMQNDLTIAMISRLQSAKERSTTYNALRTGKVDVVIGTHSLLKQKNLFHNLGLLVIDEEQRFGVTQKDTLMSHYAGVHILSMTATPIPRSLYMAMNSLRSLSLITTPPKNRLPIKTLRIHNQGRLLTEAMMRELERGGQVFYLHNQVATIKKEQERLQKLLPQHTIGVAHGQLANHDLEQVMMRFYHREIDVLVCSTIIETGIDIPNVNAIIIQKAHMFGMAQLHQLRGRVGRAHLQAYCYLVVPEVMEKDAQQRIDALVLHNSFGDGFNIAMHDLEMRGAGDLLGKSQSGHAETVGVGLYISMIERSVKMIENGEIVPDAPLFDGKVDTKLHFSLILPHDYIPTTEARIVYYQRIAQASTHATLDKIKQELLSRFGKAPDMVNWLFLLQHIQIKAHTLGIRSINTHANRIIFHFAANDALIEMLLYLITHSPKEYALQPDQRFIAHGKFDSEANSLAALKRIIDILATDSTPPITASSATVS